MNIIDAEAKEGIGTERSFTIESPVGFVRRVGAFAIDCGLALIFLAICGVIIDQFSIRNDPDVSAITGLIILLALIIYFIVAPIFWDGYTFGKKVCKIKIARVDGYKVGVGTMIMRVFISSFLYNLTLGVGYIASVIMMEARSDKRAIHDLVAGTYVKYDGQTLPKDQMNKALGLVKPATFILGMLIILISIWNHIDYSSRVGGKWASLLLERHFDTTLLIVIATITAMFLIFLWDNKRK